MSPIYLGRSIFVRGVAWGGGGQGVARVDVSVDGGSTFTRADLLPKPVTEQRRSQWSWQFFEKTVPLSDSVRSGFIGCKCKYFHIQGVSINCHQ